ncbi:MAG: PorT family protein [Flavobacteriales bacterium]|nr:PorT family protein [Flavobacteriales bacterium]
MKTNIFLATALTMVLFTTNANAQKGLSFSVKTMAENSWMLNKDDMDSDDLNYRFTFAPAVGLGIGYGITDHFGLGVDGILSFQGQRYKVDDAVFIQRNNYLKIPLMFIYNTNSEKFVSIVLKAGPQIGILMGSKLLDEDLDKINGDTKSNYEDLDFGVMLNAGVAFRISDVFRINAGLRGDFGFGNTENEDRLGYPADRASTHNLTTGLELGVSYFPH